LRVLSVRSTAWKATKDISKRFHRHKGPTKKKRRYRHIFARISRQNNTVKARFPTKTYAGGPSPSRNADMLTSTSTAIQITFALIKNAEITSIQIDLADACSLGIVV